MSTFPIQTRPQGIGGPVNSWPAVDQVTIGMTLRFRHLGQVISRSVDEREVGEGVRQGWVIGPWQRACEQGFPVPHAQRSSIRYGDKIPQRLGSPEDTFELLLV
jgi:hypothetical protein